MKILTFCISYQDSPIISLLIKWSIFLKALSYQLLQIKFQKLLTMLSKNTLILSSETHKWNLEDGPSSETSWIRCIHMTYPKSQKYLRQYLKVLGLVNGGRKLFMRFWAIRKLIRPVLMGYERLKKTLLINSIICSKKCLDSCLEYINFHIR